MKTENAMAKHFAAAICLNTKPGDYLWLAGQEPSVEVCDAIIPALAARNLRPAAVGDGVIVAEIDAPDMIVPEVA